MKKIKNTNFYIPTGDTYLTSKPSYKLEEFEMAKPYFKNNSVAIDIGAHVGFWTHRLATEFDRVIAVEPVEDYIRCLEKNIADYEHKVEVHGLGLGFKDNIVLDIDRVKTNSTLTTTADYTCDEQSTEYTMDLFVKKMLDEAVEGSASIDFIKIVVEGYELDILEGGKEVINKYKPTLFIEDKNMEDEDIADFMEAMGYTLAEDDLNSYIWVYDE
tara:strand:- start:1551 stop:2195 length:645 start_codon:yes stop_codon:yes gene_type:complete